MAALVDSGPAGMWAESLLETEVLAAPQLLGVEVANTLRSVSLAGDISAGSASLAHGDLLALRVEIFPYEHFADRVWGLRKTVTSYDAWYVALAEFLDASIATLDERLQRAQGPRCSFSMPPV